MSQMYPSGLLSILNRIKPQSKEEYDRLCINITSYLQQQSGLPQAQIVRFICFSFNDDSDECGTEAANF